MHAGRCCGALTGRMSRRGFDGRFDGTATASTSDGDID
jgi:hypothetical protein